MVEGGAGFVRQEGTKRRRATAGGSCGEGRGVVVGCGGWRAGKVRGVARFLNRPTGFGGEGLGCCVCEMAGGAEDGRTGRR